MTNLYRRTPNDIKLGIAERKVSRLRRENNTLKDRMNSIRKDYIELLKVLASESNYSTKTELNKMVKLLEAQDDE